MQTLLKKTGNRKTTLCYL